MASPLKMPTAADVRAKLREAEQEAIAARLQLAEQLVLQMASPGRDISAAQLAVKEAEEQVVNLAAVIPLLEAREAAALERARAILRDENNRAIAKELPQLIKHAMSISVHYSNVYSAFRRLCKSGQSIAARLPNAQGVGSLQDRLALALSPGALRKLAEQELNRLGLQPDGSGEVSGPGTSIASVGMAFSSAPHTLPRLENQIRNLAAALLKALGEGSGSGQPTPAAPAPPPPSTASAGDPAHGSVPSLEGRA